MRPGVVSGIVLLLLTACSAAPRAPAEIAAASGQAVFEQACAACHGADALPGAAPPMSEIARSYLASSPDTAAAVQRIVLWLERPAMSATVLPTDALDDWGLMPELRLSRGERLAVASYVITLAGSAAAQRD